MGKNVHVNLQKDSQKVFLMKPKKKKGASPTSGSNLPIR